MKNEELVQKILNEPKELSESQKQAVLSPKKCTRVIAGAGAGKTETLTRRIVYLLLYKNVDPSNIVAFTFTEKAAQAMKSRIYQRMDQLGRNDIAKRLGEAYIGTIHSFCLQILEDHFGYGNYRVFDENQEMAFLLRSGWGLGLTIFPGPYSRVCDNFLRNAGVVYNELLDREKIKQKSKDFYDAFVRYEELLDSHKHLTFDRMVYEAVMHLLENPTKLDYIKHLIVDEFQDINYSQYRLIELIGAHANIFVVGDPRQSIYQWRGSNERFFQEFCQVYPDTDPIEIPENRRSAKKIVETSNLFADCFEDVSYEHMDSTRNVQGELVTLTFDRAEDEANGIVNQIVNLVNNDKCRYCDFGILLRSVRTSATPFIDEFKRRRIPYLVGGKIGLFQRDDAQAVGRLMVWLSEDGFWVENPYNWGKQVVGDDLLDSGIQFWMNAVDFSVSNDLRENLIQWKEEVVNGDFKNFKDLYYKLLILLGYRNFDPNNKPHAASMANLGRFSSLIGDYEVAMRLGGRSVNWKSELKGLCWYINAHATHSYEEITPDDLRGVDAVQILTVHQAKGLEWPVVYLPTLVKRRFPSSFAGRHQEWYLSRDLFDVKRYEGGIEDEKRLFYVAMTRARDCLLMSYFSRISSKVSPSLFLELLEESQIDEIDGNTYFLNYEIQDAVEEDEILTFSATEILNYMLCPHHYRLNKMWGYLQSTKPLIGYGDALHFCLRYAAEMIIEKQFSPVTAVVTAVDSLFHLPFANQALSEKVRATAKETLVNFARKRDQDMRNIELVESRLEFPLQNATVIGKVDVILKDDQSFEVRDYKTSDNVISQEQSDLQLQLYTHGLRELGWNISKGSVAYLEQAQIDEISVDKPEIVKTKKKAEDLINKIKSGCFDPQGTGFCGKCEYFSICRWGKLNGN